MPDREYGRLYGLNRATILVEVAEIAARQRHPRPADGDNGDRPPGRFRRAAGALHRLGHAAMAAPAGLAVPLAGSVMAAVAAIFHWAR